MSLSNAGMQGSRPGVCTSATRPTNPYNGQVIYETNTGYLRVWDGTQWEYFSTGQVTIPGAWISFTPQLWQGATVSTTVGYAKYTQINKFVSVVVDFSITGAGTAGNAIEIRNLPVSMANASSAMGSFIYLDAGVQWYAGTIAGTATTSVRLLTDGAQNYLGLAPAVTVSNTDSLRGAFTYEAL